MKSIYKYSLVALAVVGLTACNKEQEVAAPAAVELTTETQKEAYSIGASIGTYMANHIKEQEDLGFAVDRNLIVTGFSEGLSGELKINQEDMQTILKSLDEKMNEKREAKAAELAAKSLAESAAFLEANKAKDGVVTTESGLQYEVLTEGTGAKPAATDTVKVHYVGTLTNGTEFDSSVARGEPATFPLNRVIPGWTEGVQLMSVGSKFKFVIPSNLAYGDRDTPTIPANSTLVFEVELLEIQNEEAPAADAEAAHKH
ncbi:FKBP-type peptidyl-prolyl cis-trans isomerase [Shewanella youngdeokensis]|uniref:Peptidyl-prolyl cis-trans isomerase n=1 Tax=Shewanella youngdeokensis TaxID=2999068 RepID=A0ABZ0JWG5_9GAMM|nr:FKBP-type peptidyl-prolyl cis-trans isomerase [Shewanella sp. DAU334]